MATVTSSSLGNVLIGGDGYLGYYYPLTYPENLKTTNSYWNFLAPLYSLNIAPGAVWSGGMIVLYGGTDGTSATNGVIGYNPSGDPAQTLAPMHSARAYLGYAPDANGNAYAFGGLDDTGTPLASAEKYNAGANTWTTIAALPSARFNFPAVFNRTNNMIYVFGGYTDAESGVEIDSVLQYSVRSNKWTAMASMPVAVAGSAAALGVDGKIYVAGGLSGGVATDVVQVYDPASNTWTLSTSLPEALSGSAMGVDSLGRLMVMGGMDGNGYDVSDVWRSQPLNAPDVAPVLTNFPATNGIYLQSYVSSINATASPPPVYQLISGPNGMTVDYYTGAINWTPQGLAEIGTIPVTVQAANYAGTTNWSFTITVPNPPPTLVTNLAVVSVTESSVTLSWSPEDAIYGPVTYSVWLRHVLHDPKGSGATIWYTQIGSSITDTNITISGLAAGLAQAYYVKATGPGGSSGYAGISATTLSAPMPTNFRVTGLTSTTITLAWDAPVGGLPIVSYEVLGWYNGIAAQYPLACPNIPGTSITISNLAPGTAMLWGVSVKDTFGNVSAYTYLPSLVINPVPVPPMLVVGSSATTTLLAKFGTSSQDSGGFQITVTEGGSVLQTVLIQASTNPGDSNSWVQIGSVFPAISSFTFIDTNAAQYPSRYYRVVAP